MAKVLKSKVSGGTMLKDLVNEIISISLTPSQAGLPEPEFANSTVTRVTIERFANGDWIPEGSSLCFAKYLNTALLQAGAGVEVVGRYARVEDDPIDGQPRYHFDLIVDDEVEAALEA
jgi:hypothetical protein